MCTRTIEPISANRSPLLTLMRHLSVFWLILLRIQGLDWLIDVPARATAEEKGRQASFGGFFFPGFLDKAQKDDGLSSWRFSKRG